MKLVTLLPALSLAVVLVACASVQPVSTASAEILGSNEAFSVKLHPFGQADVAAGDLIAVVGTTERDGKTYRLVKLPDPIASALRFLINDDGSFEGSAINSMGERMGWSYSASPSIKLVAQAQVKVSTPSEAQVLTTIPANDQAPPIPRLYGCITPAQLELLPLNAESYMLGLAADGQKILEAQHVMAACNDDRVKAAVEAAGSNQDLREAVKTFYVKQQSLIDAYLPRGEQSKVTFRAGLTKAQTDRDEAWSRVQLEMKLAGLDQP